MKKKTIVIVSLTLVLAILAVAVIATFPTYLFEDTAPQGNSSAIQSGNIIENDGGQGDDVGVLAGDSEEESNGAQSILPMPGNDKELGYSEPDVKNLETIAEAKNAKVLAAQGAFPEGTKVKFKKLGIFDKAYYRSRHYLRGVADEFTAYNLSAKKDGVAVFPDGTVKISFDVPEDYDNTNIAVYYLLERGIQEIDCEVSEDGKTVTVKISQTGVYILAEKTAEKPEDTTSSDNTSTESEETDSNVSSNTSSSTDTSSDNSDTSSNQSSSDSSSNTSSDTSSDSSDSSSSSTSSDSSSNSSDNSSSGSESEPEDNTSSDSTSSVDPDKETMDGWTPWQ